MDNSLNQRSDEKDWSGKEFDGYYPKPGTYPQIVSAYVPTGQELADLRARVAQLEQQNAELMQRLVDALETIAGKLPNREWLEGIKRALQK